MSDEAIISNAASKNKTSRIKEVLKEMDMVITHKKARGILANMEKQTGKSTNGIDKCEQSVKL